MPFVVDGRRDRDDVRVAVCVICVARGRASLHRGGDVRWRAVISRVAWWRMETCLWWWEGRVCGSEWEWRKQLGR